MKKFLFSLPLTSGAAMKFYEGSVVLMGSGTKVVLQADKFNTVPLQKVLTVNAIAVNHHFVDKMPIVDIVKAFDPIKTTEDFLAARPIKVEIERLVFGGVYTHIPHTCVFQARREGDKLPVFTLDGQPLKRKELEELLRFANGSVKVGGRTVGGQTLMIGGAVGAAAGLCHWLLIALDWQDQWTKKVDAKQSAMRDAMMGRTPEPVNEQTNTEPTNTAEHIARDFGLNVHRVVAHLNRLYNYKPNSGKKYQPSTPLPAQVNKMTRLYYASINQL